MQHLGPAVQTDPRSRRSMTPDSSTG
jgi:hypothetical protein